MLAPVLNRAADLGPQTFPWWKDWRGKACAIVASGPSAKTAGVEKLRGRLRVIAIKENAVELCPWADVAYGCDLAWWKHRKGLPDFRGLKIGYDPKIRQAFPDVELLAIKVTRTHPSKDYSQAIQLDEPGLVGSGGNSGFQAFNLALQFGVSRVLLIGFDMNDRASVHWYGRNTWTKANNPDADAFRRWRKAFGDAAGVCRNLGVEVVNASPLSALECFRKASVDDALRGWGL